jgi:2-phosphosulfolactate phosphatase
VLVIGAGTRGEFREEDQLCCAWIAGRLRTTGHEPADDSTQRIIDYWAAADVTEAGRGRSAEYLRATGQTADLDFILSHVDDVDDVFILAGDEVILAAVRSPV